MSDEKSFQIGELVQCRCPDGTCALPEGMPVDARAEVIATFMSVHYSSVVYVSYEGKVVQLPIRCIHSFPETPGLTGSGTDIIVPLPPPTGEQPAAD